MTHLSERTLFIEVLLAIKYGISQTSEVLLVIKCDINQTSENSHRKNDIIL